MSPKLVRAIPFVLAIRNDTRIRIVMLLSLMPKNVLLLFISLSANIAGIWAFKDFTAFTHAANESRRRPR